MPNAYYLKLGSGRSQISGSSRDPHHVGWIKLTTFHWGWGDTGPGAGGGGGSGRPSVKELHLSKEADRASPHLMLASHNGDYFASAVFEVADARTGRPTLRVNLTDVLVDNHSARDVETFTLKFQNIAFNYNPIAEDELEEMLQHMFKSIGLGPTVPRGARP